MNEYPYTPPYRPLSWVLPAGWVLVERGSHHNATARADLPYGEHKYGVVMYRRPLSDEERESHELDPVCGVSFR